MPRIVPEDVLVATVSSVRAIASMLRALSFKSKVVVEIVENGIKLTVEEGRSIQANAYLQASSFNSYTFIPPPSAVSAPPSPTSSADQPILDNQPKYVFTISLSTLLECLNIFGNAGGATSWGKIKTDGAGDGNSNFRKSGAGEEERAAGKEDSKVNTSMRMSYAGEGYPLVLLLEEAGTVTRCEITTYEPDQLMDLPFDDDTRLQKLIMKSEWLHDAFAELDPSSEKVTFHFSPPPLHAPTPYNRLHGKKKRRTSVSEEEDAGEDEQSAGPGVPIFRIESHGALGSTQMDYPNDRDVLETYECLQPIRNSYKFSHVQLTTKALASSTKTSIRTAEDGLISFQFMVPLSARAKAGDGKEGFVEFLCVALDED